MVRPLALAALLLLSCGSAELGAASVRGHLYETSFDFIAPVTVEGAGPFRITIQRPDDQGQSEPTGEVIPGRSIVIVAPLLPASGEVVLLGAEEFTAAQAQVSRITPGPLEREGERDGPDLRFPDGSFVATPLRGELRVVLEGREPGAGVNGTFRLEFQTGETVEGNFAGALLN